MEPSPSTRRRWVRFSLRTLFVLVTLICVYLGWAMNWIRQRREFMAGSSMVYIIEYESIRAPGTLWLLGEKGYSAFHCDSSEEIVDEAERLFPEAEVNPFICVLEAE